MKKQIAFLSILFLGITSLRAEIIETKNFREIQKHVTTPETLVLVDIDDTLLIPPQMLGCDEWFGHRIQKHKDDGHSPDSALAKCVAESQAVRLLSKMHLVEHGTDQVIQSLQKKGVCVMGLTVQAAAMGVRTSKHLNENNMDLTVNAISNTDHYFPVKGQNMLLKNGIIYTTGVSKGEALFAFFEKTGYTPKRIVFIDDKGKNLEDVETVAKKHKVPFVGLRYAYSDARKAAFRPDVADVQFVQSTFDHILTDEEALALLPSETTS